MHWTQIDETTIGDVTVLRLEGHLTLDAQERSLRQVIEHLIALKRTKVVLDLGRVPYIDSLGVGEIVRAYAVVVRAGGSLKLAKVGDRVHEVLRATQLTKVLAVFDSVERAAVSFRIASMHHRSTAKGAVGKS